jgi:hypothetical protein
MRIFAFLTTLLLAFSAAAHLCRAMGAVVLTAAGNIPHTNRGQFIKKRDSLIGYHERTFARAVEIDRAILIIRAE